jgi:hypothetical protein
VLSLKDAAETVGMTKPALFKAIKSGRLSATRDDKGQYQIDPAELFRVYPPPKTEPVTRNPESLQLEIDGLRREIQQRDERFNDMRAQVDDLKTDRDHWRQQATMLLTHQPTPAAAETPRPGLWRRLFGR